MHFKPNKSRITAAVMLGIMSAAVVWLSADIARHTLSDGLLRLHIVGASNSAEDQRIKLIVRDNILDEYGTLFAKSAARSDAADALKSAAGDIEKCAARTLAENGYSYTAHAEYGHFSYPEKTTRGLTLPAGEYDGLRVVLGNGGGENWWGVVFPNLCTGIENLSDEELDALAQSVGEKSRSLITSGGDVAVRFYLFDLLGK